MLILSPITRDNWNNIRIELKEEFRDKLNAEHLDTALVPLAAATEAEPNRISLQGQGFNVTLYRQVEQEIEWVILVQLEPNFTKAIYPMSQLKLIDSGGLEWMRGRPDAGGEFTGTWSDSAIDLYERAQNCSLTLDLI